MKSIFDKTTQDELVSRINALQTSTPAQWGKMNATQMLKHCTIFEEMVLGKNAKKHKQIWLGRLFGKIALRKLLKPDAIIGKNSPTLPEFIIKKTDGDLDELKKLWLTLIEEYSRFSNTGFVHPFFGEMTAEQIGYFVYKHSDHHLRQFGV